MSESIVLLPGDGIGPEVMESAVALLDEVGEFEYREGLIGGHAMDEHDGNPFPKETEKLVSGSKAVLLGAVGGPRWESTDPGTPKPEDGLLKLRQTMRTHANLRPVFNMSNLPGVSNFMPDRIAGTDFVIVRELLGGSYYGDHDRDGDRAVDTREYDVSKIEAVARTAFDLARTRAADSGETPHVTSVDKANVLATSELWREVVGVLQRDEYPDVELDNMLVDNANYQIGHNPQQFDVMLTENEFGDILSDGAVNIPGSLGLVPSASVNEAGDGIFEPIHGSAPDIAGEGTANPVAMMLSGAMMLDTLGRPQEAERIRWAIGRAFEQRILTKDLDGSFTTEEFTSGVIANLRGYGARR